MDQEDQQYFTPKSKHVNISHSSHTRHALPEEKHPNGLGFDFERESREDVSSHSLSTHDLN